ncbi:transcriptional regulator [Paenibacillus sp. CAA11]|uniref:ROK family protein n=1 Tax=Paenibacillus sp. CAA11 TaxID=1532905 RepID=UPI000D3C4081|nr:ROK family protein [Paenibacillus sp. CAA11]AWB45927.1 transcriptional regulator [Paenibacillus sp. CAA11]
MNPITNNSMRVKKINQELVRQALKSMKQGTKSMVAEATGLSVATCGNILNELHEAGEVIETELEESSGGRPARRYVYNVDYSYVACIFAKIESGRQSLTYGVANLAGEYIERGYQEVKFADSTAIDELLGVLIERHNNIKAVGIGVPGVVHHGVVDICDIEMLRQVPLEAEIREKYEVEVIVENDMNLTVYGFYKKQNYEEDQTLAVATFLQGSFPGAGIMIDGHIHKGKTRFAGEISFLPFGISREEQFNQLQERRTFIPLAAQTIASLTAVINPETVALTGDLVQAADLDEIYRECLRIIPEIHMPLLIVLEEPDEDYMNGLTAMTLESLAYSLQLVEKRR